MLLDAGADGATSDLFAVAVDVDGLVGQVHDDSHRSGRGNLGIPDKLVRLESGRVWRLRRAFVNCQSGETRG